MKEQTNYFFHFETIIGNITVTYVKEPYGWSIATTSDIHNVIHESERYSDRKPLSGDAAYHMLIFVERIKISK